MPNLTDFEFALVVNTVVFVLTLAFSTKIKDFFKGIPSDMRTDLASIETNLKSRVASYQKSLVAQIVPEPAPVVKPSAPAAPVPPAA